MTTGTVPPLKAKYKDPTTIMVKRKCGFGRIGKEQAIHIYNLRWIQAHSLVQCLFKVDFDLHNGYLDRTWIGSLWRRPLDIAYSPPNRPSKSRLPFIIIHMSQTPNLVLSRAFFPNHIGAMLLAVKPSGSRQPFGCWRISAKKSSLKPSSLKPSSGSLQSWQSGILSPLFNAGEISAAYLSLSPFLR